MFLKNMKVYGLVLLFVCLSNVGCAETITLDSGNNSLVGRIIQLFMAVAVLGIAPILVMTLTSFTRLVVVFSFLRTAMGIQQTPPNMVLNALALFLTFFIMEPTFKNIYDTSLKPMMDNQLPEMSAAEKAIEPLRKFMLSNVREDDLRLFFDLGKIDPPQVAEETPLRVLMPSFIISELRRAFEIGFLICVPFLVIDMIVSSVLMGMGMMMLPPVVVSMPFKLVFFILMDGWNMLCTHLVKGFH